MNLAARYESHLPVNGNADKTALKTTHITSFLGFHHTVSRSRIAKPAADNLQISLNMTSEKKLF